MLDLKKLIGLLEFACERDLVNSEPSVPQRHHFRRIVEEVLSNWNSVLTQEILLSTLMLR